MRILMWFALGFGAACGISAAFSIRSILLFLAADLLILGCVGFCVRRGKEIVRPACILCLGLSAGFGWFWVFNSVYLSPVHALDGRTTPVRFEIRDYSFDTSYGSAADGTVTLNGREYAVRLYLNDTDELKPGDTVKGSFRFRLTTKDGESEQTYHQGRGIYLLAYQRGTVKITQSEKIPFRDVPAALRSSLIELINRIFPEDTAFFARALLLGDRTGVDYETNTAFKVSGISHIIAVSGMHVSILFALVYLLMGKNRILVPLIGIPILFVFAAAAGFTPSVTRACIMQAVMMAALLFRREYDPPTALSFACVVMLIVNPLVITSVSFQLSVGSMTGVFLFYEPINTFFLNRTDLDRRNGRDPIAFAGRTAVGSVSVTLSTMTISVPLTAWHFGTVSLIGVVTNLLVFWVIAFIFYGIMVCCLLGAVSAVLGGAAAWIVSWPIRYVLFIAKLLSKYPLAAVYTKSVYVVAWLALCYILLTLFLLSKQKKPLLFACCVIFGLFLSLVLSWAEPMAAGFRVTVLDVGQGQSILLQSRDRTFVVDCGGDYDSNSADIAAETLLSQGISRIDGLILTHFDRDHAGAVPYLLTRIQTDAVFVPDAEDANGVLDAISDGNQIIRLSSDAEIEAGEAKLNLYGPTNGKSANDCGLCVLFQADNCDILIMGDRSATGERILEESRDLPDIDILVVSHHGADSSTCAQLLGTVRPEIAVISVGENSYGQPSQQVLNRLADCGCAVYRTDLDGTLIFRR